MKSKSSRRHMDVNVEELDQILDGATHALMSKSDCQKVKAAVHVMAERLRPKRSTEKTSTVIQRRGALASQPKPDTDDSAPRAQQRRRIYRGQPGGHHAPHTEVRRHLPAMR